MPINIEKYAAGITLPGPDLKSGDRLGPGRRFHIQVGMLGPIFIIATSITVLTPTQSRLHLLTVT
jgi:hypothetical protein